MARVPAIYYDKNNIAVRQDNPDVGSTYVVKGWSWTNPDSEYNVLNHTAYNNSGSTVSSATGKIEKDYSFSHWNISSSVNPIYPGDELTIHNQTYHFYPRFSNSGWYVYDGNRYLHLSKLTDRESEGLNHTGWAVYNIYDQYAGVTYDWTDGNIDMLTNFTSGYGTSAHYWPVYSKLVYNLTLKHNNGSNDSTIYYWYTKGWYSDSSATNSTTSVSIPTRTGYSFDGYYVGNEQVIKSNGEIKSEYTISSNTTAKAKWTAKTYTVTFDLNNPMTEDDQRPVCDPTSKIVTYDSSYGDLPTPSRVGYNFDGWYTEAIGGTKISSDIIYKIANDSTIYAHWTKKKYNIKAEIDSDGLISVKVGNSTSGISSTEEVEYWDSVTLVAKLDSHDPGPGSEWAFDSWKLSNSTVSNKASYIIEHVTSSNTYKAYAYMGVKKFILTIKREDESIKGVRFENYPLANEQQMPNVTFGQTIIIHAVPENGNIGYCVFDGWYKDGSLISSDADTTYTVTGNDILIAKGHIEIPRYKISLKNNGCNNTNQNGGVVSITYEDGYGYNSGSKQVNPGETKSFYVLRDLSNNSSLKLKVEDIGYGYQFKNWVKDDWSLTDLEWEARTVTQSGTYEANFELWNLDGATWKGYYIFVKTSDSDLPWKIVKEIDVRVKEGAEEEWKLSSKAPSQP